ncbi:hypothetical protein ABZP36_009614 [Zizania latifolia]
MARLSSSSAECFVVLISLGAMAVAAAPGPAPADRCQKDLDELMGSCERYLSFPAEPSVAPSTACCGVVRKVDVPCLCTHGDAGGRAVHLHGQGRLRRRLLQEALRPWLLLRQ